MSQNAPTPLVIDPALFREDAIAPETAALNAEVERLLADMPTIMEVGPKKVRARRAEGEGALANQPPHSMGQWETASALGREVPVRVFHPGGTLSGVYLHIHGGGHTLGSAGAQDQSLAAMAERTRLGIVSVEYRLAPEHPWPAPADDCEAAALWLAETSQGHFGTDRITIGGESAGAHLAATTILRLRDRHAMVPFQAANLVYGIYDASLTPSAQSWGERNLIISTPIIRYFIDQLLPPAEVDFEGLRDPEVSPLYKPLHGLCPALFTVGTLDPLVDDTLLMAAKWNNAGNAAELAVYPGGIHAFDAFPGLPIAEEAKAQMEAFLIRALR